VSNRKRTKPGRRSRQRKEKSKRRSMADVPISGASTIWPGLCIPPRNVASERSKGGEQGCQFSNRRGCRGNRGQSKLPSSSVHPSKVSRRGMTVRASMDVDFSNVSIHGWANVGHRTTNCLPSTVPTFIPPPSPLPSTLPN
jgi:hypothetical protein